MGCDLYFSIGSVKKIAPLNNLAPLPGLSPLNAANKPDLPKPVTADPLKEKIEALPAKTFDPPEELHSDFEVGPAPGIVSSAMGSIGSMAHTAQAQALASIGALANFAFDFTALNAPAIPEVSLTLPDIGAAPDAAGLTPSFPSAPLAPTIATLSLPDIGAPPAYDVPSPDLQDIALPDPLAAFLPSAPVYDAMPFVPEPDFILPAVPTLLALNLPDAPLIDLPLFADVSGTAPGAPDVALVYAEAEYASAMLSSLNARLTSLVTQPQSGIDGQVEAALWERGRDREALLTHRAVGEALRLMASRGLSMPEGTLVRIVQQALQAGLARDAGLERTIAIDAAQLKQANFKFALDTALALEARMIALNGAAQGRALEAAKASMASQLQLFNARLLLFSADAGAFAMRAQVFKARMEQALARLTIYKSQISAQQLVGEINAQDVAIYRAQLGALTDMADVYRTRIAVAKEQIASDSAIVDDYRSRIEAFSDQVAAKAVEYDNYTGQVRGQVMQAENFGIQVAGYKSRVDAFDALAKARLGQQTLSFKQNSEYPLALYKAQIDAYKTGVSAAAEQLRATATLYESRIRAFSATEGAIMAHVGAEVEVLKANTSGQLAEAQLLIEAGRANLDIATGAASIAQNNLRAAGQLAGQMSAAAIAAQGVHATINEHGSDDHHYSETTSSTNAKSFSSHTSNDSSSTTSKTDSSINSTARHASNSTTRGASYHKSRSNRSDTSQSVHSSTQNSVSNNDSVGSESTESFNSSKDCSDVTTYKG